MVSGRQRLEPRRGEVIEHGSSRLGRWLQERRLRIALWIAVVEGLLVVVHVINRWVAFAVAVAAILVYFLAGRESRSQAARQSSWIVAASQAMVVLVPILLIIIGTFALIAVGVIAVVALVALFSERPA